MKTRLSTRTSLIHVLISIVVVGLLFSVNLTMADQTSTDLPKEEINIGMEVDTPARILRAYPPRYPSDALENSIEGSVLVRFLVDTEGKVQEPQIVQSNPEDIFDQSTLDAVMQYEFAPAVKDGMPVNSIVTLPINYGFPDNSELPGMPGLAPSEVP